MTYSVIPWRGFFYIKGEEGDPPPPVNGPYRFETDARIAVEELNKKLEQK